MYAEKNNWSATVSILTRSRKFRFIYKMEEGGNILCKNNIKPAFLGCIFLGASKCDGNTR